MMMTGATMGSRPVLRWAVASVLMLAATPGWADVKTGVDAWSRGDYPRAIAEWRGPALAGDADAQFNMGQAYKLGRGVPADIAQAEIWYQKAAAQGHAQAQDNYGLALFQDGRKADALPWLEKSSARDEKRAELVLGTMLFNGDAVPKDWVRAYALVNRSSQQGLPQASQTLAQLDGYLSPEQRQQGLALASRIADQGRTARMSALANGSAPSNATVAVAVAGARRPRTLDDTASQTIASVDVPRSAPAVRQDPPARAEPRHPAPIIPARHDASPTRVSPAPTPSHETAHRPPAPVRNPQPAVAGGGRWKVQLGAFRDDGNAHALWAKVGGRVGGKVAFVKTGGVTRLQAGPFASRSDAERACHAAGAGCVVLP